MRVKHTFEPPHICNSCYWEERHRQQLQLNRLLRAELTRYVAAKRGGRKPVERERDDDDREHTPDLLDEMTGLGRISLDG